MCETSFLPFESNRDTGFMGQVNMLQETARSMSVYSGDDELEDEFFELLACIRDQLWLLARF